jgi:hypothetical protein
MADQQKLLILGGLGVLGYFAYTQGWFSQFLGVASSAPSGGAGGTQPATQQPVLTAADAAVFPYSGSVTAAQMNAISSTLQSQIAAGQIPQIAGNSVLAYMLGWGGLPTGTSKTASGETYVFDGTNWNLQTGAVSGPPASDLAKTLENASRAYGGPLLTVSQWNWVMNNITNPGSVAAQLPQFGDTPIDAASYVRARTASGAGMSGLIPIENIHRRAWVI